MTEPNMVEYVWMCRPCQKTATQDDCKDCVYEKVMKEAKK